MQNHEGVIAKHRAMAEAVQSSKRPIIVFQLGKVGSTSTARALKRCAPGDVFQVHRMFPERVALGKVPRLKQHHYASWALFHHVIVPRRPALIVTMVREPISRNLSAYFQNREAATPASADDFIRDYSHGVVTGWFKNHFEPITGIDVYEHPFDHEAGWLEIPHPLWPVLILRNETDDAIKAERLAAFTELPVTEVAREHVGENREYAELYGEFKRTVKLPAPFVDKMMRTRYARHFYSDAEREQVRERWVDQ